MVGPGDGGHGGWDPYGNNRGALYVVNSGLDLGSFWIVYPRA